MSDGLFFIDSSSSAKDSSADQILFDNHSSSSGAVDSATTPSIDESFISVEKEVPPQLAVSGQKKAVDPSTRKLQHDIDVRSKIYFNVDVTSLLSHSSKNRISSGLGISKSETSSSSSASSISSKADQLVASLLDDSSSSGGDSRVRQALSKSVITDDFGE